MIRNLYNKYCCGYDRLEDEMIPLRKKEDHSPTVTSQPRAYHPKSNRWYPSQPTSPVTIPLQSPLSPIREVSVFTKPSYPQPSPTPSTWDPCLPNHGRYSTQQHKVELWSTTLHYTTPSTLHYTTPYQYFYQQSTLRASGFVEQGKVISNPAALQGPSAQQIVLDPAATLPHYNLPHYNLPHYNLPHCNLPHCNPYFEMSNMRYKMSGLGGYGACTGNPYLTPNHLAALQRTSITQSRRKQDEDPTKRDSCTNTTLQLTNTNSSNHVTKSRDKGTGTNLVIGVKKRNRTPRPPHRRLMDHQTAPGAERSLYRESQQRQSETQQRQSETQQRQSKTRNGQTETRSEPPGEQLVLVIKVENPEEFILDSMKDTDSPQQNTPPSSVETECTKTSLDILTPPTSSNNMPSVSPLKTTSIEEVLTENPEPEIKTLPEQQVPQTPSNESLHAAQTPGIDNPKTPVIVSPLTPLSPGFEWCEEYEYELVEHEHHHGDHHSDHQEHEEEEPLEMELNFDLESPETDKPCASAQ